MQRQALQAHLCHSVQGEVVIWPAWPGLEKRSSTGLPVTGENADTWPTQTPLVHPQNVLQNGEADLCCSDSVFSVATCSSLLLQTETCQIQHLLLQ